MLYIFILLSFFFYHSNYCMENNNYNEYLKKLWFRHLDLEEENPALKMQETSVDSNSIGVTNFATFTTQEEDQYLYGSSDSVNDSENTKNNTIFIAQYTRRHNLNPSVAYREITNQEELDKEEIKRKIAENTMILSGALCVQDRENLEKETAELRSKLFNSSETNRFKTYFSVGTSKNSLLMYENNLENRTNASSRCLEKEQDIQSIEKTLKGLREELAIAERQLFEQNN